MSEEYIKIVYQTPPIGKEGIILELTTFDIEKYNKDKELEKIKKYEFIPTPEGTNDSIYGFETRQLIKKYINKKIIDENAELMKIIERQQQQIANLIMNTATPKLTLKIRGVIDEQE